MQVILGILFLCVAFGLANTAVPLAAVLPLWLATKLDWQDAGDNSPTVAILGLLGLLGIIAPILRYIFS